MQAELESLGTGQSADCGISPSQPRRPLVLIAPTSMNPIESENLDEFAKWTLEFFNQESFQKFRRLYLPSLKADEPARTRWVSGNLKVVNSIKIIRLADVRVSSMSYNFS